MSASGESTYSGVARTLHWLMALWILVAYLVITWLTWGHTEGPIAGLNTHKAIGFTLLVPLVLRVAWRIVNPPPPLPAGLPRWQVHASGASHLLLYLLMFAMPVTGYLGNFGGVDYGIFKVPPFWQPPLAEWIFAKAGITSQQWDVFFDTFHYRVVGPYVLPVVVLLHAGAAVFHHVVQKDDVLRRMLPQRGR